MNKADKSGKNIKKRVLTGDRPTGPLHVGHYVGSLKKRLELANSDEYDVYIMVADIQALTDNFNTPEKVRDNTLQVLQDNLAIGIKPEKAVFFLQSAVPQIAELTVLYANLVTVSRLERNPTVKDELMQRNFEETVPLGFLMYPVSQAADITIVKGELVPVGEDQVPHIEQTREIVRKFNSIYGNVLPEPKPLIGDVARLVGLDGNSKMSKSLNNCIFLIDSHEDVKKKIMSMYTDPNRIHPTDPGNVIGNPVFIYHDAFNPNKDEVDDLKRRYELGKVGDVEVKEKLVVAVNNFLDPIRENRKKYSSKGLLVDILSEGTKKALKEAAKTMDEVKSAVKIVKI